MSGAVLLITFVIIIFGLLMGFARGMKKSILRIILVFVSIAFSFILKNKITELIMNFQLEGGTVKDIVLKSFGEDLSKYTELVFPIIEMLVMLFVFVIVFVSLQSVSMIIYCILKLFIRKKKDGIPVKKHRLIGSLIGFIQGGIIAVVLIAPLNGLVVEAQKLMTMTDEFQEQNTEASTTGETNDELDKVNTMLAEYSESGISKFYTKLGGPIYRSVASTKNAEGKKLTLGGQIDAFLGAYRLGMELMSLQDVVSGGFTKDSVDQIKETFANLDAIKNDLSDESKETINDMIQTIASDLGDIEVDISNINVTDINFTEEAEVVEKLYEYKEAGTVEDVGELVEVVAKSDLILPVVQSATETIELTDDEKAKVEEAIDNLDSDTDPEKIAQMKSLFGIA